MNRFDRAVRELRHESFVTAPAQSARTQRGQKFALAAVMVGMIVGPTALLAGRRIAGKHVQGEPFGDYPPFHAFIGGYDHMNEGFPVNAEVWYNGSASRLKSGGMDLLVWIEKGGVYRYWKPDGILAKDRVKWAKDGRNVTPNEQKTMFVWQAPSDPLRGKKTKTLSPVAITVKGSRYQTQATYWALPMSKEGSTTTVEWPTTKVVYRDLTTKRVVRTEYVVQFRPGKEQVQVNDFVYGPIEDSVFNAKNLTTTIATTKPTPLGKHD